MKKKINIQFLLIAFLAIAATWVFAAVVFYEVVCREIMDDLKGYAKLLAATRVLEQMEEGDSSVKAEGLRISLIKADGSVLFDSNVDIGGMENHRNRPEVAKALEEGAGEVIRQSPTLGKSTFYYAVRTEQGDVLRLAKESSSIFTIFTSTIPVIIVIAALLFGLCMVLAHYLTRSLVAPIERMADRIDDIPQEEFYRELSPVMETIRRQHEEILKNARTRQEFTANVSHELKTPLTAISGYSELIETGMTDEETTIRFAGEIHHSSRRLLTLINDIIRLSELDTAEEEPMEEVDLLVLAQSCVDMLQISAKKHQVTLELAGEPTLIRANKGMIEEVVYNLCDNAIRYNRAGGRVWVETRTVRRETSGQGQKSLAALTVRDTGIGIPAEHQERIFERFYRVDKSRSKSTGGIGLGLAIVKHIAALHDAALELESEEGVGTEIRLLLPLPGGR